MATTSLWHIEGRLKDLIAYVENPEKTKADNPNSQPLWDVFSYVSRPEATEQGEYVSAVNCLKEIALQQMILTKKQYGKENGYIAWHGYQSFKPGEVTPEQAHQIGLQLAKEMWGDRFQIIVTTHLDKDHLHNHFCFNSVSFLDGKKYNYSKSEQRKLREVSDRICREHGLSVIENPHRAPSRQVWLDEKSGKPTRYNVYREDVKEAINFSRRPYYMEEYLRRKGYITDFTGRHWKIRLPQYEHFTRLDTLDERWTPEHIQRTMGAYASFGNRRALVTYPPQMPQSLRDWFKPFQKTSHIYRLYLHYCYLLGVLPKKTTYRPTSPYLKEDLKKLEKLSEQVRYMSKYGIETFDDLYADRERLQGKMDKLIAYRTKLQNKIRRASPAEKETLREEKSKITEQITALRKQLSGCDFIVALGGGAVLDSAVVVAAMATNPGDLWDYVNGGTGKGQPLVHPGLPIVTITLTAGTGSEVNCWGVISNLETKEKIGFGYPELVPVLAVVDPELMKTVPEKYTAYQGFDALFHNTEVMMSKGINILSETIALSAIENIAKYLPRAVKDGNDLEAREHVAYGSTMAGISMQLTSTTAQHSMEHAMSAYHHDLPHGAGLIMISRAFAEFFLERHACDEQFVKMARMVGIPDADKSEDFITALVRLQKDCGVADLKMSDYGITADECMTLAINARETMGGLFLANPCSMSDEEFAGIFEKAYR